MSRLRLLQSWMKCVAFGTTLWANAAVAQNVALQHSIGDSVQFGPDVASTGWAETTVAAIGPGEHPKCTEGRLFFTDGHKILASTLKGQISKDPSFPRLWKNPSSDFVIDDNHIVKLKNNDLLFSVEAVTYADAPESTRPNWWSQTQQYNLKQYFTKDGDLKSRGSPPGGRGIVLLFRSTDCGQTWDALGSIDAIALAVRDPRFGDQGPAPVGAPTNITGLCARPRIYEAKNPIGKPSDRRSEAGGWDGHFLYADPHTGDVYLSTPCQYGTGQPGSFSYTKVPTDPTFDAQQDVTQEEGGMATESLLLRHQHDDPSWGPGSWTVVAQGEGGTWRNPIASLASGRLAYGNVVGNDVALVLVDPPYQYRSFGNWSRLWTVKNAAGVGDWAPDDEFKTSKFTKFLNIFWYVSIAVSSTGAGDRFLVSYPEWKGTPASPNFTFKVYSSDASGWNANLISTFEGNSKLDDRLFGTLIEGPGLYGNSLFVWLQRIPAGPDSRFAVRSQVISGETVSFGPDDLTVNQGQPQNWSYEPDNFFGDYLSGTSYVSNAGQSENFVTAWNENGKLTFNTVSVFPAQADYGQPAGNPARTCGQIRAELGRLTKELIAARRGELSLTPDQVAAIQNEVDNDQANLSDCADPSQPPVKGHPPQ